jgi:protein TonB
MFADSLLETSWAHRSRRSWSALTSFGLQAAVLGTVLVLSLLKTIDMPRAQVVSTPISLGRPDPAPLEPHTPAHASGSAVQIISMSRGIMAPSHVPTSIATGDDSATPAPQIGIGGSGIGLPIGSYSDLNLPITGNRPMPVAPKASSPSKPVFRTSTMLQGSLLRMVKPTYPPLARTARIEGPVILEALISKAGTIQNLHATSGHPMLTPAAIDAVRQWQYRPYILNGEPIEVETQITVTFLLSGN